MSNPSEETPRSIFKNRFVLVLVALVITVGLAAFAALVVVPHLSQSEAERALRVAQSSSPVTVGNGTIITYESKGEGSLLPGANPKQIALSADGKNPSGGFIEFRSDEASEKSHVLDLYLDLYSQRSRDLIALGGDTLQSYIESGKVVLRVHPVIDEEKFSVFAAEAIAEVAGTHPERAWGFFTSLMRNSDSLLAEADVSKKAKNDPTTVIDFIAKVSREAGVPTGAPNGVDADSIKFLSFFSWVRDGADDKRLAVGYYPPVLYVDGEEVDQEKTVLTDPNSLLGLLSSLS